MAALNATLVARQAGDARGFHAVAGELRGFSRRLSQDMDEMSRHIFMLAMEASTVYKNSHRLRLFAAAREASESVSTLDAAIDKRTQQQQIVIIGLQQLVQNIHAGIGSAKRLCNSGRALARSAMIEASYSNNAAPKLKIVAGNVESSINSIYDGLKVMDSKLV